MSEKYLLYAEDDLDDQEMLADALAETASNIKLICVNDGYDVIHYLNSLKPGNNYPCAVVLDINMPGLGGLETLKVLREDQRFIHLPVLIFSTSNHRSDIEAATSLGATEFITKPIKPGHLETIATKFAAFCHKVPLKIR